MNKKETISEIKEKLDSYPHWILQTIAIFLGCKKSFLKKEKLINYINLRLGDATDEAIEKMADFHILR